jgi:hypothetical protein
VATHSYCFSAQLAGRENVGSALNSTIKENINQVVALPQSTNFGNVCFWHKADIPRLSSNVRWG